MSESVGNILELLTTGRPLSDEQASFMFDELMAGRLEPAQAGAFFMGLRCKGEDSTDLAAGVRAGLANAVKIPGVTDANPFPMIDTCGTGGDGQMSFNCSTAVALFLADMGYKVVKHGNRAASSSTGSADALEALGVPLDVKPEDVLAHLERDNFIFLFAAAYHPAFRYIMPVRKALAMRTIFNFMGPLLNPARPSHQLVGVGDPDKLMVMGETLLLLHVERALIIHGAGGFDELTPFGPVRGYTIRDGLMEKIAIGPSRLGFREFSPDDVRVPDRERAVAVLRDILAGHGPEAMMQMTALNLAASLWLMTDEPLKNCADIARDKVHQGLTRGLPGA
ncbi:MAG: anthranilate phosphoribosyltransferase [Desulfovibrionaceae bacterium]